MTDTPIQLVTPPRYYQVAYKPFDSVDSAFGVYQDKDSAKKSFELLEANAIALSMQKLHFLTRLDIEPNFPR